MDPPRPAGGSGGPSDPGAPGRLGSYERPRVLSSRGPRGGVAGGREAHRPDPQPPVGRARPGRLGERGRCRSRGRGAGGRGALRGLWIRRPGAARPKGLPVPRLRVRGRREPGRLGAHAEPGRLGRPALVRAPRRRPERGPGHPAPAPRRRGPRPAVAGPRGHPGLRLQLPRLAPRPTGPLHLRSHRGPAAPAREGGPPRGRPHGPGPPLRRRRRRPRPRAPPPDDPAWDGEPDAVFARAQATITGALARIDEVEASVPAVRLGSR